MGSKIVVVTKELTGNYYTISVSTSLPIVFSPNNFAPYKNLLNYFLFGLSIPSSKHITTHIDMFSAMKLIIFVIEKDHIRDFFNFYCFP